MTEIRIIFPPNKGRKYPLWFDADHADGFTTEKGEASLFDTYYQAHGVIEHWSRSGFAFGAVVHEEGTEFGALLEEPPQ